MHTMRPNDAHDALMDAFKLAMLESGLSGPECIAVLAQLCGQCVGAGLRELSQEIPGDIMAVICRNVREGYVVARAFRSESPKEETLQ